MEDSERSKNIDKIEDLANRISETHWRLIEYQLRPQSRPVSRILSVQCENMFDIDPLNITFDKNITKIELTKRNNTCDPSKLGSIILLTLYPKFADISPLPSSLGPVMPLDFILSKAAKESLRRKSVDQVCAVCKLNICLNSRYHKEVRITTKFNFSIKNDKIVYTYETSHTIHKPERSYTVSYEIKYPSYKIESTEILDEDCPKKIIEVGMDMWVCALITKLQMIQTCRSDVVPASKESGCPVLIDMNVIKRWGIDNKRSLFADLLSLPNQIILIE
ncbi:MAG: hypothetical protein RSA24_04240 [Clostridia bacterium]